MTSLPATRLQAHLAATPRALGLFVTNGFPDPDSTGDVLAAAAEGGADFVELGMPFSDPLAEGLPIQRASARALGHGVRMADAFRTAEAFVRAHPAVPLVLMGYVNPVVQYGVAAFCRDAAQAGVAGLILPDLPPDEGDVLDGEAAAAGLGVTYLVAPNTPEARVRAVDARSTGFVYAVSSPGLTGGALATGGPDGDPDGDAVTDYLDRTRAVVSRNPLLVGFGLRTPGDAARLAPHADGVIVGSALIEHVEQLWADAGLSPAARRASVEAWARAMKRGACGAAVSSGDGAAGSG